MVVIFGKRIPLSALLYLFIVGLLVISMLLPWVYFEVSFPPPRVKLLAAEGRIRVVGYITGYVYILHEYIAYGAGGEITGVSEIARGIVYWMIVYFILVMVATALYFYIFLLETEKVKIGPEFLQRHRFLLETVALGILLAVAVSFIHVHNVLAMELITGGLIVDEKGAVLSSGYSISQRFSYTTTEWRLSWAPGFVLFFIVTIIAYIYYVDKYFLKGILNLAPYWRVRGLLTMISVIMLAFPLAECAQVGGCKVATPIGETELRRGYHTFTSLFHIAYYTTGAGGSTSWESKVIVSLSNMVFVVLTILIIFMFVIFLLGAVAWPCRYVIKAEPFITLALPDEEILRRHKALPSILAWKKALDIALSVIAGLTLVLLFIGFVKFLGQIYITVAFMEHLGILWTTPAAYILALCLFAQTLLILKPTK